MNRKEDVVLFPWNMLFPFGKNTDDIMKKMNSMEFQPYMEKFFSQFFPNGKGMEDKGFPASLFKGGLNTAGAPSPSGIQVFETHDSVYVRVPVRDSASLKRLKIYHTTNQLILDGFPEKNNKELITLPSIVKKKGASALLKEDILEISIPKGEDMQYSEINFMEK
ncbi:Hsp20/alpha crystallin family protein [Peribacillus kribbensis]|uniref:Hsp20/alpha crystallin family protein n=1 Tax=Peribacillus kribbensis TaxID=356658 RepID=UPI0004166096|nr:Hsp20/alpha crystallin family protein [Peribacillus kribbensis]